MCRPATDRTPWDVPLSGALAAAVVAAVDGVSLGLDPGGVAIFGLRATALGLAAGAVQVGAARIARRPVGRGLALAGVSLVALAWSVWAGLHLSRTATIRAALPASLAIALPIAVLLVLTWLVLAVHRRLIARRLSLVASLASLALGVALLVPARWLSDLHGPLSLSCAVCAWLAIELAFLWLTRRSAPVFGRELGLLVAGLALVSPLMPIPVADAYSATDRSVALGLLVGAGRTESVTGFDEVDIATDGEALSENRPADTLVVPALDLPRAVGRSLVLISIDALRADRQEGSTYPRRLTPNIDAFARRAIVFERAYAPSPTSSFSVPALHAGMPMEAVLRSGAPLPETLAERLRAVGYATYGFYPQKIFSAGPELLGQVERTGFGFERKALLAMEARADGDTVRRALGKVAERPVFVWIHFYDPHLPYDCHGGGFGSSPLDCYDAEVAHADAEVGRLLPWLEERLGDPVIAITADHGEAFGEHGRLYHSADLHEEQIRVPLQILVPGAAPGRVEQPVSIADLAATLYALVAPAEAPGFAGHDLRPAMLGPAELPPVTASIRDKRAIVVDRLKLMCNDWPGGPCALYDLAHDPAETRNLVGERPADVHRLLARLRQCDRAEVDRLRAALPRPIILGRLGRVEAVDDLLELARSADASHREEAARTLAMLREPRLAEPLSSLHGADDPRVAAWACVGSALIDETCQADLPAARVNERDALGRWSAVALGRLRDVRGLAALIDNLEAEDPVLRAASAIALGQLGDRRAVEPLIRLLDVKQTRWAAIEALGTLGDARAVGPLTRLREGEPDETNLPRYDRALLRILAP
ncbi:MAG: sulfatase-like hydrolase/transferase [Deltaproteobacteria bacterium]|nr:sulfatase-like hydrolase/transferase [Deltaproteobacteria bacterium]